MQALATLAAHDPTHCQLAFAGFRPACLREGVLYLPGTDPCAPLWRVTAPEPLVHLVALRHRRAAQRWCFLVLGQSGVVYHVTRFLKPPTPLTRPTLPVRDLRAIGDQYKVALLYADGRVALLQWVSDHYDHLDERPVMLPGPADQLARSGDHYSLVACAPTRRRLYCLTIDRLLAATVTLAATCVMPHGPYRAFHYAVKHLYGMGVDGHWRTLARDLYPEQHPHTVTPPLTATAPYTALDYSTEYCRVAIGHDHRVTLGPYRFWLATGQPAGAVHAYLCHRDMMTDDAEYDDDGDSGDSGDRLPLVEVARETTLTRMRDYEEVLLLRTADGRIFYVHTLLDQMRSQILRLVELPGR